jgi:hypothetical protein
VCIILIRFRDIDSPLINRYNDEWCKQFKNDPTQPTNTNNPVPLIAGLDQIQKTFVQSMLALYVELSKRIASKQFDALSDADIARIVR